MSDNNFTTNDQERLQRHDEYDPEGKSGSAMRAIFGVIMIIIYVGMGILLLINFFNWSGDWEWTRYGIGVLLIVYGFWRAYRQVKGID